MTDINGAELFARSLAAEGIELLFGLPSPEVDPLFAVLGDHGIRLVPIRHEAAAAHMAEGLYKTTGKVAAVLGNPGPGSANLLPGVLTALHEGVPLLAITSQHRLGLVYPSSPATFQGQDQIELYRPATKWNAPILLWERIPEILRMAFREMWNGRPGPVHVDLPAPILFETGDPGRAPVLPPAAYRAPAPRASDGQLDEAAALLARAHRPLVLAGAGVDRGDANDALLELVELLGCPVITSQAGRATVPSDHPHAFVGFGPAADAMRREADVVVVVGSRLGNLDTPYDKYWGDRTAQKLIQIDVDPSNLGVTRPLAVGIVGDARSALAGLGERLAKSDVHGSAPDDLARYRTLEQEYQVALAGPVLEWQGPGIHPAHAMGVIGARFGRDAVYTVDGGNTSVWAYALLPPTRPRSYHSILELGMLGTGIPSAVGAKIGAPDREVVCVTGDGAAGFNIMEMQTAARENLDITTIVFAEGSWTMEEPSQLALYGRTFGTAQGDVRWDVVAEGLGCHGEYVERIEDLDDALQRAQAHHGPSLVCIRSDRDANRALPAGILERFSEAYTGPA